MKGTNYEVELIYKIPSEHWYPSYHDDITFTMSFHSKPVWDKTCEQMGNVQ